MAAMGDQALLDALVRQDFRAFLQKAFHTVAPGDVYHDNWHLGAIDYQLHRVTAKESTRLIITIPPRSLKSITISVAWVAWRLGHDPSLRFVCCSYSGELALKHARDCRLIMQSSWYRSAFPGTILSRDRNAEHDFQTTAQGGRFSTSVGGTLTGRGGDIIIIDDPIKPDEATSEVTRKSAIEWFGGTLASRLNDKAQGAIILVMQRLHEEDLAGHLLEAGGWDHLCLPAIAVEDENIQVAPGRFYERRTGDLLHPSRETRAVLDGLRAAMGSAAFEAQYQQSPIPPGGNMIDPAWLVRYEHAPERRGGDEIVQSWDCASKDGVFNDWTVCITALLRRRSVYILDIRRERLTFPKLAKLAVQLARLHTATAILIEDAASGTQLIQHLRHEHPTGVPQPIPRRPDGDKITRMSGASARIEARELVLPKDADWLAEFERELRGFPHSRYDDQVDALSQLLNWSSRRWEFSENIVGPMVFTREGRPGESPWHAPE